MSTSFINETELPGRRVDQDTLQIIAHRYYWAAQFMPGLTVLEIGCGPGLGLGVLAQQAKRVIGGDIIPDSLRLAKRHYGPNFGLVNLDAHKLPFADKCIDVVVCLAAIIYVDLPALATECYRILKPGGQLIINTPNKDIPGFRPSHLSRNYYSVPELNAVLTQHRFDAKLFGAFRVLPGGARLRAKIAVEGRKIVGRLLRLMGLYTFVKKTVRAEAQLLTLREELAEEIELVQAIPVVPLDNGVPNRKHRIIYVVAQVKQAKEIS